jgi:hypothetical protein
MPPIESNRRQPGKMLTEVPVQQGISSSVFAMQVEVQDMWDVLLGREEPPVQLGPITLMEIASAYFARASEMAALIKGAIREGRLSRGCPHDRFRTGELREFQEVAKGSAALGSRRITALQLRVEEERLGRGKAIES